MTAVKIIATLLLLVCFIVGILKADKRWHSSAYPPMAEYTTGFIMTCAAVGGFYFLWFD